MSVMGFAAALAISAAAADALVVHRLAGQPLAGLANEQRRRRDRRQRDARRAEDAVFERHRYARAGDGDIHLVARDEAQIARAGVRLRRRQMQRNQQLARRSALRPGAGAEILHRHFARRRPAPAMRHVAPSAISIGIASALGAALHRLPPIEARP